MCKRLTPFAWRRAVRQDELLLTVVDRPQSGYIMKKLTFIHDAQPEHVNLVDTRSDNLALTMTPDVFRHGYDFRQNNGFVRLDFAGSRCVLIHNRDLVLYNCNHIGPQFLFASYR